MGAALTEHQALLLLAICSLVIAIIFLSWITVITTNRAKVLNQKLADPEALPKALAKLAMLSEKIENGNALIQQIQGENSSFADKLRHVNAKLYPPVFKHDDSQQLKTAILKCRDQQLSCILNDNATSSYTNWEWFGSKSDGHAMVTAYKELLISAFNAEFDTIRRQMRAATLVTAQEKLLKLREQLERLSETVNCTITSDYFNLKLDELDVWASELEQKEEEKQRKKKQQKKLREQNKLNGGDIDTEAEEEQLEFTKSELAAARKQASELAGLTDRELNKEIAQLEKKIANSEEKLSRATSEAQKTRAGYIYVISNVGSFGAGVVKIGMTRRLEPMDRVTELGDASVPFRFDIHTLAFVENAPTVERKLHDHFDDRRLNTQNTRKEFFRVEPQEVQSVLEAMGVQSDWYFDVEAREYRETLSILTARKKTSLAAVKFPESI